MNIEYRTKLIDHVRFTIGDKDKLVFETDEELDTIIRARAENLVENESITYYRGYFYPLTSYPVLDMTVSSGTADTTYRIDENSRVVKFVEGTEPTNRDTITITYVDIDYPRLISDILTLMATDRTKLAVRATIEGETTDLTLLRSELMKQAGEWSREAEWRRP